MRDNELRQLKYQIDYYQFKSLNNTTKKNEYETAYKILGSIRSRSRKYINESGKVNYDTEIALFTDKKLLEKSMIVKDNNKYEVSLNYREPNDLGELYYYYLKRL